VCIVGPGGEPFRQTTQQRVVDFLRKRILSGVVPVGGKLLQNDVSKELGVSTTPVREAFRTLEAEGLVRIDSHQGAVVRELTSAEQIEVLELLRLVEVDNLRHAVPRFDAETLRPAEDLHQRMLSPQSASRWIVLNRDFHLALGSAFQPAAVAVPDAGAADPVGSTRARGRAEPRGAPG